MDDEAGLEPIKLHPEITRYFSAMNKLDPPIETRDPLWIRATMDGFALRDQPPRPDTVDVEDHTVDLPDRSFRVRLYRPKGAAGPLPVMLYFHGGGFIMGNLDTHDRYVCYLTETSGCAFLAVEYRLAPEHPYPAPDEDALAALLWVRERAPKLGLNRERIGSSGDSGGAQLTASLSFKCRDLGAADMLKFQLLIYPGGVSDDDTTPSFHRWKGLLLTPAYAARFKPLRKPPPGDPYAFPLLQTDLSGLPPAYVVTCEYDICRDQGEAYAMKLMDAGVPTTLHRVPQVEHPFFRAMHVSPYVRAEMREMGRQIRRHLIGDEGPPV